MKTLMEGEHLMNTSHLSWATLISALLLSGTASAYSHSNAYWRQHLAQLRLHQP